MKRIAPIVFALLLIASCAYGLVSGYSRIITSGNTSELVGNSVPGSSVTENTPNYQYWHKLTSTASISGTLSSYKVTIATSGSPGRTLNFCLYTDSGGYPNTLIANSCTGAIEYSGNAYDTIIFYPLLSSVSVSAGTQYWVSINTSGYGTIAGSTYSGTYYGYYANTPEATFNSGSATSYTGTAGILQIEVTQ